MAIIGGVYYKTEQHLADIEVVEQGGYKQVRVIRNGTTVVLFPLAIDCDTNEIALRTTNVINQTGLVDNPVRVELTETE